jgi:hypothetical protein
VGPTWAAMRRSRGRGGPTPTGGRCPGQQEPNRGRNGRVAHVCAVGAKTREAGSRTSGFERHGNGRRHRFDSKFEFKRFK